MFNALQANDSVQKKKKKKRRRRGERRNERRKRTGEKPRKHRKNINPGNARSSFYKIHSPGHSDTVAPHVAN